MMQNDFAVANSTVFSEPTNSVTQRSVSVGNGTVLNCQLCRWQSFNPDELLRHMQEYHHIDTEHVVSRQATGKNVALPCCYFT